MAVLYYLCFRTLAVIAAVTKMAVAWRRHHRPTLETQVWHMLQVEGEECIFKSLFSEDGYELLMIGGMCEVGEGRWPGLVCGEKMDGAEVARRSKSLNPDLEAPLPVLLANLSSHLHSPPTSSSLSSSPSPDGGITLTLNGNLSRLPFLWEFHLKPTEKHVVSNHLITPLLSIIGELCRRQSELIKIIGKKDREIQDYKDQGTTVSRRHLATVPFDEKAFENEMMVSQDFEHSARAPLATLGQPVYQELYRDVAMIRTWDSKKNDLPPEDPATLESGTTGTWAGRLPASLLPSLPSHPSPHTSPSKSPVTQPPVESPSKDDEKARREALEKKLEDDKLKSKKKKKRLM